MHLKISPVNDTNIQRCAWALAPVLTTLKFFGIYLPTDQSPPRLKRLLMFFYGCFWFANSITFNVGFYLRNSSNGTYDSGEFATTTSVLTKNIYQTNTVISEVGVHLVMLLVVQRQWLNLWTTVQHLTRTINLPYQVYRRCRYISLAALLYVFVQVRPSDHSSFKSSSK
jgi:hypothetical protein